MIDNEIQLEYEIWLDMNIGFSIDIYGIWSDGYKFKDFPPGHTEL